MSALLRTFLRRLHSRPAHERRILGMVTYITAAVLVTALWISSLEQSLELTAGPRESRPTASGAGKSQASLEEQEPSKIMSSLQEQITPWQALGQAAGAAISGFKELGVGINRLSKLNRESTAQPSQPQTETRPTKTQPEAQRRGQSKPPETIPAASPAKILTAEIKIRPYSGYTTAKLIRPSPESAGRLRAQPGQLAGIKNIFYYNLGEMRQAAVDFYRYLTE